ncbi:MAG: SRPBCC domain-containing protein [Acidimicrobiales bacterium]|jgi:uncharacterized protein YndB with AHSA1/START domain
MTPAPLSRSVVRLERTIPAPPPLVYRAWLDPDPVARWMAPGSYEVTGVEIDERVGGRYRIRQANEGVDVGGFDCQILELVADRRIVWHWGFAGPGGPVYDSLMTVTLRAVTGGATALTLLHERLDELAAALPEVADKVAAGWENVLSKLAGTPLAVGG